MGFLEFADVHVLESEVKLCKNDRGKCELSSYMVVLTAFNLFFLFCESSLNFTITKCYCYPSYLFCPNTHNC